ncbi:MAG: metallophosphoesterase family protein [Ardenticatenales bacterium]|nr:metallophosphoesterase family protein [Ardenticatenales bacterium]
MRTTPRGERAGDVTSPAVRLGLVADTHGWLDPAVLTHFAGVELIVHAGDIGDAAILDALRAVAPVLAVRGNIDFGVLSDLPLSAWVDAAGARVASLHIAGPPGRPNAELRALVDAAHPDLVVVGHSHVEGFWRVGGALVVNPGAAGHHGFHERRTAYTMARAPGADWQAWRIDLGPRGRRG